VPKQEFLITPSSGKRERLDLYLSRNINELTRAQIQENIKAGRVRVNGIVRKPSYRLKVGEKIEIDYSLPPPLVIVPQCLPLQVLYCDDNLIVIDKPSGMVVHPGAGVREGTLVNALLYYFPEIKGIGHFLRPGIVHRLDKDASGVMVVARNLKAYEDLKKQFKERKVEKTYLGLVWGKMPSREGRLSWSLGRHTKYRQKVSIRTKKAREAETLYTVKEEFKEFSLLEIKPITGRTHQIRVHFSASGHPLVGDKRYGARKSKGLNIRLFLHAYSLAFQNPESRQLMKFISPLPLELETFLNMISGGNLSP